MISFNKPYFTGEEIVNFDLCIQSGHVSGNGPMTQRCQQHFSEHWGFTNCLLTSSGTDALEMAALLIGASAGDEVIVPSYTFVSSALAFARERADIVFIDSRSDHPGMDESAIEEQITSRTKAIVVVHYAGVACDMDKIMALANEHKVWVVEDAAQAIGATYKGKPLGSIGHVGCFSFHETKNIHCGEGGLLVVNDSRLVDRAKILWEKGTNRAEFFEGKASKYGWVDTGSSFLMSDITASLLLAQLSAFDRIQAQRIRLWNMYNNAFIEAGLDEHISLPLIPPYASNNAHNFYIIFPSKSIRDEAISKLKLNGYQAVFHYLALHRSEYYLANFEHRPDLPESVNYEEKLLRLPFHYQVELMDVNRIVTTIQSLFL